jgi:subtilisin family serine protease
MNIKLSLSIGKREKGKRRREKFRTPPFAFRFFCLGLLLGVASAARIEPDLVRRLEAAGNPNQKFAVSFFMKDQARAADLDPNIPNLPKPERRARVGRVLMDFAEASQQALLSYLRAKESEGKVEDISPLWIVNSIGCWATPEVIHAAAARSDVDLVYYDRMPCELGNQELKIPPAPRDGVEPNLVTTNARGAWNQGYTGQNVVISIVDTGVRYTHLDLSNHLWDSQVYPHHGFNFASSQYSSGHPGPSSYDTLTPLDYYGHGTHCAGIAVADGSYGNGTRDTMGVAPSAKLMVVAVDVYLHTPYPDTSVENNTMEGFQFSVRPYRDTLNGADVITTSMGYLSVWLPRDAVWRRCEENILAAGIVHSVASGIEGYGSRTPGNCPPPWRNPANHPIGPGHENDTARTAVVTVCYTDNTDTFPGPGSGRGIGPTRTWGTIAPWFDYEYPPGLTDPDFVMPGISILSTAMSGDTSYTTMTGTSMATPGVAGVVALMLSKDPALTPLEIDSILEMHCVFDMGFPGKDDTFGAGRPNCSLAVAFTPLIIIGLEEKGQVGHRPLKLSLQPNPASGKSFTLNLDASREVQLTLDLFSSAGKAIFSFSPIKLSAGRHSLSLPSPCRRLPPGAYFLRVKTPDGTGTIKVVIANSD